MKRFVLSLVALLLAILAVAPPSSAQFDNNCAGPSVGFCNKAGAGVQVITLGNPGASVTLSNGNLTVTANGNGSDSGAFSTNSLTSGKLYLEVTVGTAASADTGIGIANGSATFPTACSTPTNADVQYRSGSAFTSGGASAGVLTSAWAAGNVIGMALDIGGGTLGFRNITAGDNWNKNVANNPAVGGITSLVISNPFSFIACIAANSSDSLTVNFNPSAGNIPSGYVAWQH